MKHDWIRHIWFGHLLNNLFVRLFTLVSALVSKLKIFNVLMVLKLVFIQMIDEIQLVVGGEISAFQLVTGAPWAHALTATGVAPAFLLFIHFWI